MVWWVIWLIMSSLTYVIISLIALKKTNKLHLQYLLLVIFPLPYITIFGIGSLITSLVDRKMLKIEENLVSRGLANKHTVFWWKEVSKEIGGKRDKHMYHPVNMYKVLSYPIGSENKVDTNTKNKQK